MGRPKKTPSELVPKELAMRDRFLTLPLRPGVVVSARVIPKNGKFRLMVTLSWKAGEFIVTGYDNYNVREWSQVDQVLKRLWENYDFKGRAVVDPPETSSVETESLAAAD